MAFNTGHSSGIEALEALGVHNVAEKRTNAPENINFEEKGISEEIRYVSHEVETIEMGKGMTAAEKVDNMEEIALFALHVEDDSELNPWTVCIAQITAAPDKAPNFTSTNVAIACVRIG